MKRFIKNSKEWHYFLIRKKYQEKRQKVKWKTKKENKKQKKKYYDFVVKKHTAAEFIQLKAPDNFSFINNTNEVLNYFSKAKKIFQGRENVDFDISDVSNLTSDTIALLVANVKNPKFIKTGSSRGNAPKKDDLRKLFTESGFAEHISLSSGFKKSQPGNLLHKEVDRKVAPDMAVRACTTGLEYVFKVPALDPSLCDIRSCLYEILSECMANTHNHAALTKQGECRWWMYAYNNPTTGSTSYTFIDLGVGIFKSAHIEKYKKLFNFIGLYSNIKLVNDLLEGKIHSRIEKDRELRGKGMPQIVKHSKNPFLKSFYIITNDVKIDLKNGLSESLSENFEGTFLHWELTNK